MRSKDCKERSDAAGVDCRDFDPETGKQIHIVKQEFKQECDLNYILSRYTPEDIEQRIAAARGVFADVSESMSYQEARQFVIDCDNAFNCLPAKLRSKFDNDPSKLVEFIDDPANEAEAIELGLKERPQTKQEPTAQAEPVSSPVISST